MIPGATGRITIDLSALRANWRRLAESAPSAATGAAVKADCYGLGAAKAVAALYQAGCRHFFVATPGEGITIRRVVGSQAAIYVFTGLMAATPSLYRKAGLIPILNSVAELGQLRRWSERTLQRLQFALHVETGMNRLGLTEREIAAFAQDAVGKNSPPVLIISHLACADDPGNSMNRMQLQRLLQSARHFPGVPLSLANSAGILLGPEYHLDITRPGISLYGGQSQKDAAPMLPVVTLEGKILQIRDVAGGESIGYGASITVPRNSRIAIAGIGYADGILRSASGHGVPARELTTGAQGWINGHMVPMIGRISMDMTAFDVTTIPEQTLANARWVEFFGNNLPLEDLARAAGTIGYEVLTRLSRRSARIYLDNEKR